MSTRAQFCLVSVVVALFLPFPTGRGYYPVARALWDLLFGDVGHGPRWYWVMWGAVVLAVYTVLVYVIALGVRHLLKRYW